MLETLYGESLAATEPETLQRVVDRMGALPVTEWPEVADVAQLEALLTEHGRQVCVPEAPRCGGCEFRKLCSTYRIARQEEWRQDTASSTVVDLFCGAGGASLGFVQAGFKLLLAVDIDPWALATFRLNHPEVPESRVLQQDLSVLEEPAAREQFRSQLRELLGDVHVNVVVGGPPCQGFSQVGTKGRNSARARWPEHAFRDDSRNRLYRYFLMLVDWLQPDFCVMENVPPMVQLGGGEVRRQVLQDLRELGYVGPTPRIHECYRYGVPQRRERALFIAGKQEFGDLHVQAVHLNNLGDAIRDLPPLDPGTGQEVVRRTLEPDSAFGKEMAAASRLIHNHVARPHQESDVILYSELRPGERIQDRPDLRYNKQLMKYDVSKFKDTYKRQNFEAFSSTVVAHLSKDGNMFIHPNQARTYTVREAARVQSFPDDFILCGSRTHQFRQVGNAIPPMFMRRVAGYLNSLLGRQNQAQGDLLQLVFAFDEPEEQSQVES